MQVEESMKILNRMSKEEQAKQLSYGQWLNGTIPTLFVGVDFHKDNDNLDSKNRQLDLNDNLDEFEVDAIGEHTNLTVPTQFFPNKILNIEFIMKLIDFAKEEIDDFNLAMESDGHDDYHTYAVKFEGYSAGLELSLVYNTYVKTCKRCNEYYSETNTHLDDDFCVSCYEEIQREEV